MRLLKLKIRNLASLKGEHEINFKEIQNTSPLFAMRLLTFPNVLITSHQGFLTHQALSNIAETTLQNVTEFEAGEKLKNEVGA